MTNEERKAAEAVLEALNGVIPGKEKEIREVLIVFVAGGHILLEDIPGVGKTTLAITISKVLIPGLKYMMKTSAGHQLI